VSINNSINMECDNMNKEKSLKIWRIDRENRRNKKIIAPWVRRKEFYKLTRDKKCFGKVIEGIKPELMSDEEYMNFVKPLPESKLRL